MFYFLFAQTLTVCLVHLYCKGVQSAEATAKTSFKVLDFSFDNDGEADTKNVYTHASLQKGNIPSSFTICTAFMVEQ